MTECASQCGVAAWLAHLSSFKGLLSVNVMNHQKIQELEKRLARVRLEKTADELRTTFVPADCSDPVLYRSICRERIEVHKVRESALVEQLEREMGQLAFALDE